jgi:hypothetical protein
MDNLVENYHLYPIQHLLHVFFIEKLGPKALTDWRDSSGYHGSGTDIVSGRV